MSVASAPRNWLPLMLPLMLLGLVIGMICIPLNAIDSISDHVLTDVFALGDGLGWFVLLPLIAMPLVLQLQQRLLRVGAGSGIPQADACIEEPELAPKLLGLKPLLSRLVLSRGQPIRRSANARHRLLVHVDGPLLAAPRPRREYPQLGLNEPWRDHGPRHR